MVSTSHDELVTQIKEWQRYSFGHKQTWYDFITKKGSGTYDPSKHELKTLQEFVGLMFAGTLDVNKTEPEGGCGKDALVRRVKWWQKNGYKESWYTFVGMKGSTNYDPNRHDERSLEDFLVQADGGQLTVDPGWDESKTRRGGGNSWGGGDAGSTWDETGWGQGNDHQPLRPEVVSQLASWMLTAMNGGGQEWGCGGSSSGTCDPGKDHMGIFLPNPAERRGDWVCSVCSSINFGGSECSKCGTPRGGLPRLQNGDTLCLSSGDAACAADESCQSCTAPRPEEVVGAADAAVALAVATPSSASAGSDLGAEPRIPSSGSSVSGCSVSGFGDALAVPSSASSGSAHPEGRARPRASRWDTVPDGPAGAGGISSASGFGGGRTRAAPSADVRLNSMRPNAGGDLVTGGVRPRATNEGWCEEFMRPGDWTCLTCGNINFSKLKECHKCGNPRGKTQRHGMKPGDWICEGCGDLVFASKWNCKMCGSAKPPELDDSGWGGHWGSHPGSRWSPY